MNTKRRLTGRLRPLTNPADLAGFFCFGCWWGDQRSCSGPDGLWSESKGDFLDVLSGGGEQALGGDSQQTSEAGVAVAVKLFGVGKGTFDRLLAPLVDALSPGSKTMGVGSFARVGPDMARDQSGGIAA